MNTATTTTHPAGARYRNHLGQILTVVGHLYDGTILVSYGASYPYFVTAAFLTESCDEVTS
jgi:hypothetical protein